MFEFLIGDIVKGIREELGLPEIPEAVIHTVTSAKKL